MVTPAGSTPPGNPPSAGTATADPEGKSAVQQKLNDAEGLLAVNIDTPVIKTPSLIGDDTPVITLTADGMDAENLGEDAADYSQEGNLKTLTIHKAGTTLTFSAYEGDSGASLTVVDGMDADTDFGENDPTDGIYCKGMLVMNSGTYSVTVNGDCLKGTGKKGEGGIWINDGRYTLHSGNSNALKSKNGNIVVQAGTIQSTYTAGDSINAKNYSVIITGGRIEIDQCYGDGIQGEDVNISGEDSPKHLWQFLSIIIILSMQFTMEKRR